MVFPAVVAGGEARVVQQVAAAHRGHQPLPGLLVSGEVDHQGFLVAGNEAVDAPPRKVLAGDGLAAVQVVGHVGLDERQADAQQRGVHELAAAGVVARQQCSEDAVGGEHAGGMVGDRDPHHLGLVEVGHEAQHAAQGLADGVEARLVAVGPVLPVSRDGAVDEPRVEGGKPLVVQAQLRARLRAEILQQDVGLLQQLEQDLLPLGLPQVQGQTPLVAVERPEARAVTLVQGIPAAVRVAPVRQFHLDDVAPEITEQTPAKGPGHMAAQVQRHGPLQCRVHDSGHLPFHVPPQLWHNGASIAAGNEQ